MLIYAHRDEDTKISLEQCAHAQFWAQKNECTLLPFRHQPIFTVFCTSLTTINLLQIHFDMNCLVHTLGNNRKTYYRVNCIDYFLFHKPHSCGIQQSTAKIKITTINNSSRVSTVCGAHCNIIIIPAKYVKIKLLYFHLSPSECF